MKCSICGKEMIHPFIKNYFGNNPYPVRTGELDRCCDECNDKYVIYYRFALMRESSDDVRKCAEMLNELTEDELITIQNM